jgi:hypothetical protein
VSAAGGRTIGGVLLGQNESFLGDNLLPYLMLALGGALFVGNVLAVARPPARTRDGNLERAPVGRSLVMAGAGLVAFVWALASLVAS